MSCTIRKAKRGDELVLIDLIKGLAEYENDLEAVDNTPEKLGTDLFDSKICEAILAEQDGQVIGFAIYYTSYSTWKGPCMYLEDLYLVPEARGTGAGGMLFDRVVEIAKEREYARMDWQIIDWNTSAIEFYKKRGAQIDEEWLNGRLFFR
ncbi:MAG: GNAT family N-acetyltransferase [Crocinitomicaceae bacterium]|nr:GNAT family N-acetyltransferase [Flavobacteriales bacterium]NQZ36217.1 GNAT family N-acetyltransferase [Crocinitomicaceae bacterium]